MQVLLVVIAIVGIVVILGQLLCVVGFVCCVCYCVFNMRSGVVHVGPFYVWGGFAIDYLLETFVVFRTCGQAWIAQLVVCVVSGKLVGVGL